MFRAFSLALVAIFVSASPGSAEPVRFKFTKGQILTYHIVQATKVSETIIDEKTEKPVDIENVTKHTVIRKWKIVDVDAMGVATMEMTIDALKLEHKRPNGEVDVFDSQKPDDMNQNEMAKLIGPVLAVVRIDQQGKLVEVKESKSGSANRFAIDLPLKIILPESSPVEGQSWDRSYTIKLDPPHGTGESYKAVQKFTAKAPVNGFLTIGITTIVTDLPAQANDQIPLLPMLLEGEVYFHTATGRYHAARLKLKKELVNHQGDGTKYTFESTYSEDLRIEK